MVLIRDPEPKDEQSWRRLWAGYVTFYEAQLSEEVTAFTWQRMLAPDGSLFGRLAEWQGKLAGFTVSVLHQRSWTLHPVCYLEDLFVDPQARGHGLGRALIKDLVERARAEGWWRLYWHTRAGNAQARRLYDKFAKVDDFVRYRLLLR